MKKSKLKEIGFLHSPPPRYVLQEKINNIWWGMTSSDFPYILMGVLKRELRIGNKKRNDYRIWDSYDSRVVKCE